MVTAEEIRCEPKHVSAYMPDEFFRRIFIANKGAMVAVGEDDATLYHCRRKRWSSFT